MIGKERAPFEYTVAVSEYPDGVVDPRTEEQRLDASRDQAAHALGGKVVSEKSITLQGVKGRDYVIQGPGQWTLRNRLFWVGNKFYHVSVASGQGFENRKAEEYFLDSFRFEKVTKDKQP